jgi:cytidyltransferase-like protein
MSGSIGANRIPRAAVETTLKAYIDKVLKKFPGFKSAKISGSYNTTVKPDHGDIDLVINIEGDEQDRKKLKQNFAAYISSLSDDITIPFTSGRHVGKKAAGTGDIVIVQFAIEGYPDLTVQIDNMIVASEQESEYRKSFLDLPAEKQGLLVGLAKAQLLEEDPIEIFKRLGITNIPKLDKNQELEFNLSNKGLTLRLVTLGDNFKELSRNEIWTSFNWSDVEKLFKDYKLDGTWEELLESINSKLKNSRSRNRVKGIFNSLVVINAGEAGTDKGNNKLKAKDTVDKLLENMLFKGLVKELIMPLLEDEFQETIAIYPGKFKPPHKGHFEVAKQLIGKVDKIIIAISAKEHDGITAQQSEAVWKLYNTLLDGKLDIEIIKGAPVGYVLDTIAGNFKIGNLQKAKEISDDTWVKDMINIIKSSGENGISQKDLILKLGPIKDLTLKIKEFLEKGIIEKTNQNVHYIAVYGKGEESRYKAVGKDPRYMNAEIFDGGTAEDEEGKIDASNLRIALNKNKNISKFLPKGITPEEYKQALGLSLNELEDYEIKYWALYADLYKALKDNPDEEYKILKNELKGERLKALNYFYYSYLSKDAPKKFSKDNTEIAENILLENTSLQLPDFKTHLTSLTKYMVDQGMNIKPYPALKIINNDFKNAENMLGKTAYYDPTNCSITLYTLNRHPKDILRSYAHEMIHRMQDNEGRLKNITTTNTNEDGDLEELEKEAYLKGNMCFRNWEDTIKTPLNEWVANILKYKHLKL